jgi:hypothetical protein
MSDEGVGLVELTAALREVRERFDLEAISAVVDIGEQLMTVSVGRGPELMIQTEGGEVVTSRGPRRGDG